MTTARLLIGDVFARLAEIPDGSIDLVLTSPPFLALRSYLPPDHPDKAREIGSESTPAEYLATLLRLSAAWRPKLAPHGSAVVELGDTYAGSGGAGGDYSDGGLRDGQQRFDGTAARARYNGGEKPRPVPARSRAYRSGWPLDKSLTGIPTLYAWSLAYGRHLLTGEESPAGMWRIRNVVAWARPNPPVGRLGDKYRPATSYLTVATLARDRWFDLDAVRTSPRDGRDPSDPVSSSAYTGHPAEAGIRSRPDRVANAAGAPPLDWWEIPPGGYSGAHYAVWPPELCERPIETMCPRRVCRTCGEPSRRISRVEPSPFDPDDRVQRTEDDAGRSGVRPNGKTHAGIGRDATTVGWSTCGCPDTGDLWDDGWVPALAEVEAALAAARRKGVSQAERHRIRTEVLAPLYDTLADLYRGRPDGFHSGRGWRPGLVLDPFAGSGTTLMVATGHGRDAIGIDIDERNAALALERLGLFLDVEHHTTEEATAS